MNDELRVDVVASWCFIRLQRFDGRFKLFYCKIGRQVGIGGGSSMCTSDDLPQFRKGRLWDL